MHAADVSIGDDESLDNRLNIKLQTIDSIFRDIYGATPSVLEAYTDGRSAEVLDALAADSGEVGTVGLQGMASLARLAQILNNRTETVDDRIKDLRIFKTITVDGAGNSTGDTTQGTESVGLMPHNNSGSIKISSENKWIILKANTETGSFSIGHYKKDFSPTASTLDLNTANTFNIINLAYDAAGHIIEKDVKTITLPNNYKTIALQNAANTAVAELSTNNTSVVANTQVATVTYIAGNKWIRFAGSNSDNNKSITFAHALSALIAGEHVSNYTKAGQTPNFGDTVNVLIPTISFTTDEAGHVTAYNYTSQDTTIVIPKGSLTTDSVNSAGNVITNVTFTDTTGAIVKHFGYIGDLLLNNYSAPSLPTGYIASTEVGDKKVYSSIAANQSLNTALAQLQSYAYNNQTMIDTHVANVNNPHNVTKTQVGLGNVDNAQQIQALSGSFNNNNVGHIALWQANNLLSISEYTIGCSVPANAVFTDTTYSQASDTNLGLVKLYNDFGENEDGAMTQASINEAMQDMRNDTDEAIISNIRNILDNFELKVALPKAVSWSINQGTNALIATTNVTYQDGIATIQQFINNNWVNVVDPTAMRAHGDRFRLYYKRTITIGGKEYSNEDVIGEEYIEP